MSDPAFPFRLLAITPPEGAVAPDLVDRWLEAADGIGLAVLLRDPGATPAVASRLAALSARCRDLGVPRIWSVDAATLLEAPLPDVDGVQLRADPSAARIAAVRGHLDAPPNSNAPPWIGRSVHGAADTMAADGVDYSVFAPVFTPRTTATGRPPKKAAGLTALRRWTARTPRVFALGGVDAATAAACVEAGAYGLASIRGFFGERAAVRRDVAAMVAALRAGPPDASARTPRG